MQRVVLCCVAVLLVGGCGSAKSDGAKSESGGGSPNTSTKAKRPPQGMPRRQLLARVNRACEKANAVVDQIDPQIDRAVAANDLDAAADGISRERKGYRPYDRALAALKPRAPERDAFKRFIRALKRQDGIAKRIADAYRAGDIGGANALYSAARINGRRRITAAIDLGADKCGKP